MTKIETLISKGFDNCIIFTPANRFYLTGFESEDGILLISDGSAYLAMDSRYIEAAQKTVTDCEVVPYDKNFFGLCKSDAVCETGITIEQYEYIKFRFKPCGVVFSQKLSDALKQMRTVKTEDEIKRIKTAAQIGDKAFEDILGIIKPGITEAEIALQLEISMRREGASKVSFDTIVLSGKKGSMPHGVPDNKEICSGELVTMDFGCVYMGYCSDMTRTVAVKSADSEQRMIYETVLKAQKTALKSYKPGIRCSDADGIARRIISDAGYGKYFGHSLGHGVGIDIHEYPTVGPKSDWVLEAGNIVTDEPGIYIPSRAGVRVEDLVLITENGNEILSRSQKELIIV